MAYKAGLKARPLPRNIFTNTNPFGTDRVQTSDSSWETSKAVTEVSPKSLVMEDREVPNNSRDSMVSSQPSSDSSLSSAPTEVPSLMSSGEKPSSIDSDTLVDSAMVSPRNSDPIKPSSMDRQTATQTPLPLPPLIALNPKGPLKTPSEKRIFSSTGTSATSNHHGWSSSNHYAWNHSRRATHPYSQEDDAAYVIETDKPATFPYLTHAYPLRDPGSEDEAMTSPTYANVSRDFVTPVLTIIRQGMQEWYVRSSADWHLQGITLRGPWDMKTRQVKVVEQYCVWESIPPSLDE